MYKQSHDIRRGDRIMLGGLILEVDKFHKYDVGLKNIYLETHLMVSPSIEVDIELHSNMPLEILEMWTPK